MSEVDEDATKVALGDIGDENQKETYEKMRKVVQIMQNKAKVQSAKIVELQKQSELKDKIIAAAKENLKKIQEERDLKSKEFDKLRSNRHGSGIEVYSGQVPQSVLERIQVGNTVWCLVQFPETSNKDLYDEDDDSQGSCTWVTQDDLVEHVNSVGCTLDLPLFSLSSAQATALRNDLADYGAKYDSLSEEYKKYRVDVDVMMWNKNTQIESLKNSKQDSESWNNQDFSQVTDTCNSLRLQKQSLKEKVGQLTKENETLQLDKEEMKLQVADLTRRLDILRNECEEWRWKYKEEIKRKRQEVIDTEVSQINNKETMNSLKQELEYMKSKNDQLSLLLKKLHDTTATPTSTTIPAHFFGSPVGVNVSQTSNSTADDSQDIVNGNPIDTSAISQSDILTKTKYLRSLFYNYLCSRDKNSRLHMQTALMTIFQFSPEEVIEIKKRASATWR